CDGGERTDEAAAESANLAPPTRKSRERNVHRNVNETSSSRARVRALPSTVQASTLPERWSGSGRAVISAPGTCERSRVARGGEGAPPQVPADASGCTRWRSRT